jgi:uncharacterized membrane protein
LRFFSTYNIKIIIVCFIANAKCISNHPIVTNLNFYIVSREETQIQLENAQDFIAFISVYIVNLTINE